MAIKASSFKNWCTENISPQSWTRICLKRVDDIRSKGYTLKEMEDLNPDIEMDDELMESLNSALSELYEMTVNESLLAAT
ncbi:MAG: hypothetical protein RLN88_07455 [Ekhidna sp.]|uniref:hypothetical protein n=1 Tax=Ekhidna sp. TaxID=2608089 RepID=UPI0032EEB5C0